MLNKSFSINLNFDSLGEAYGWPNNYKDDKAFSNGIRRIIKIIQKYNIPVTFFIVGKDLENKKNFEIVKRLSDNDNVEIANHSYNHLFNFGSRNKSIIYNEIYKSHEIIYNCTGKECKGFISPTWSVSKNVIETLIKLKYEYDTSYFQSASIVPAIFKIFLSHILDGKFSKSFQILDRRDYFLFLKRKAEPFFLDSNLSVLKKKKPDTILEIPMPTINRFSPPVWHTVGYIFGWKYLKKNLLKILKKNKPFFYLIHPADILDGDDQDLRFTHALERMNNIDHEIKISNLEMIIELILSNGYNGVKVIDLARQINEK